ncbi:GTPase ObgE [compost metagenome]
MDMPEAAEHLEAFRTKVAEVRPDLEILPISSLTREGIQELLYRAADLLDSIPEAPAIEEVTELNERKIYKLDKKEDESFVIKRENEAFIVESPAIERMMKRMQLNSHEAILKLARTMRHMGIDDELRKRGAEDGTIVRIGAVPLSELEISNSSLSKAAVTIINTCRLLSLVQGQQTALLLETD